MGNLFISFCQVSELQQLSSLTLDICPFPSYEPNTLIHNMLMSPNSSFHLSDHYRDVQNSLSPSELAHFTRRLRTTFGREGKVTMGTVGVVALALAVLFDTLAKEVKGQWVPESGPIPGLFLQEPGRTSLPSVPLVSEYLRLVPHIANNPARVREETEKCLHKLEEMRPKYQQNLESEGLSHVDIFNSMSVWKIAIGLQQHHRRLSNSTSSVDLTYLGPDKSGVRERKSSFNCDLEMGACYMTADNTTFQQVLKRNEIREELKPCINVSIEKLTPEAFLADIECVFLYIVHDNMNNVTAWQEVKDFDLKAKSHLPF